MKHLILLIGSVFLFSSCASGPQPSQKQGTLSASIPLLLVSVAPYQSLVQQIAGSDFQVHTVAPLGANPHTFEPTAKQISAISQGSVWFRIGEPFEKKISQTLQTHRSPPILIDLRESIDSTLFGTCCQQEEDRHIWLSPRSLAKQIHQIAKILEELFPKYKESFHKNAQTLSLQLDQLDQEISSLLMSSQGQTFLTSHPAFGYFCRDYHLQQLPVEQEGKEPRPKQIETIAERAKDTGAKVAIAIPEHSNQGVTWIAKKLHIPIKTIDPYSPHYFDTMRELAHALATQPTEQS